VPHNYFDERIAKAYEARWAELFDTVVVDPAVDFLAGLAAAGHARDTTMTAHRPGSRKSNGSRLRDWSARSRTVAL